MHCGPRGKSLGQLVSSDFQGSGLILLKGAAYTYREIDQMKLSHADMLVSIHTLLTALDGDGEDSVRPGAVFIHVCCSNRPFTQGNTMQSDT